MMQTGYVIEYSGPTPKVVTIAEMYGSRTEVDGMPVQVQRIEQEGQNYGGISFEFEFERPSTDQSITLARFEKDIKGTTGDLEGVLIRKRAA